MLNIGSLSLSGSQFGTFEGRKCLDGLSRFSLSLSNFVQTLQIEPEFRACSEEMAESQSCVTCNCPATVQDFRDPICRNIQSSSQLCSANFEFLQFFRQMFSGMNCR